MTDKYGRDAVETALTVVRRALAEKLARYAETVVKLSDIDDELDIAKDQFARLKAIGDYLNGKD